MGGQCVPFCEGRRSSIALHINMILVGNVFVVVCSTHTRNTFIVLIHLCLFLFKLTLTLLAVCLHNKEPTTTKRIQCVLKFRRIHLSELPVHLLLLFNCFYLSVQMSNVIYTLYGGSLSQIGAVGRLMKLECLRKYKLS